MSIALMTSVFASAEPREAADRLMLLALADNANDAGVCWPGIDTLAGKCAVTRSAVMRTLTRLEESGHVQVERRPGHGNVYHVLPGTCGVDTTRRAGATRRAHATRRVDATPGADATPTRRVDATGTRRVDATPPVASTRPEPSENHQENPHHNHQARGDGALTLVRPPADVVVVGDDREGGMPSEAPRSEPGASGRSVEALIERGVTEPVAARLASDVPARIDAALAAFDRSGQYGPGWLVRAVEAGWAEEKTEVQASREQGAARPPQGAYGPVAEPRRMQAQAVLWLEQQGRPASALAEFFEPAGTWEMDPDTPPVPMYRLRASAAQTGAVG